MKLASNRGSASVTVPISEAQVKAPERWAGYDFVEEQQEKKAKTVYHPRSNLTFEKVTLVFVVLYTL